MSNISSEYREASPAEIKVIQLKILEAIDAFFKKKNYKYYIAFGSLIGTIRHKGYIPWDDDIDLWMMRKDYEDFIRTFNEHDAPFKVNSYLNPDHPYCFAKVIDRNSISIELIDQKPYTCGIGIDLFPIDNMPESEAERKRFYGKVNMLKKICTLKTIVVDVKRVWYKTFIIKTMHVLLGLYSVPKLCKEINKRISSCRDAGSKFVGDFSCPYGLKAIFLREWFKDCIYMPFENISVPVPCGYDEILRQLYGDYMKLPPADKQVTHHDFTAYVKKGSADIKGEKS